MREKYEKECAAVVQNCTYTAETHHIIACKQKRLGNAMQIAPAVIAAILGVLAGTNVLLPWTLWLSVIAAVVTAVGNVLNPFAEYYTNLNAAKSFTILKQDARGLLNTFSASMTDDIFASATHAIHDRYNDLVRLAPPTDPKSFEKARKRVQSGVHELDKNEQF